MAGGGEWWEFVGGMWRGLSLFSPRCGDHRQYGYRIELLVHKGPFEKASSNFQMAIRRKKSGASSDWRPFTKLKNILCRGVGMGMGMGSWGKMEGVEGVEGCPGRRWGVWAYPGVAKHK